MQLKRYRELKRLGHSDANYYVPAPRSALTTAQRREPDHAQTSLPNSAS